MIEESVNRPRGVTNCPKASRRGVTHSRGRRTGERKAVYGQWRVGIARGSDF
jgi:hypothetical protein